VKLIHTIEKLTQKFPSVGPLFPSQSPFPFLRKQESLKSTKNFLAFFDFTFDTFQKFSYATIKKLNPHKQLAESPERRKL